MDAPETQFVDTEDGLRIAYQVFGDGPPTVQVPAMFSSVDAYWEPGLLMRLLERTAANVRAVIFDHRGSGRSDDFESPPTLAERALDIKAVMQAAGMDRASLMSFEAGAQVAIAFAAEYPERVDRLVIHNGRVGRSTRPQADELAPDAPELVEGIREDDGSLDRLGIELGQNWFESNPSLAKYPDQVSQALKFEQTAGSRAAQKRQLLSIWDIDVVEIAPRVEAPTLIIHSAGNRMHHVGYARYLAQLIPNASLLELPGDDQMYWISDNWKDYVDAGITFVTDADVEASVERKFAVVMFTDIVRSTESSADIGDSEWRNRLDLHDRVSAKVVAEHQGEVIKHTGDGILATFEMPSSAIDAAVELQSQLSAAEIAIRVGLHAGEVEVRGSDISGTTVNLAARTQQAAPEGLIYTSTAIRQMLLGSQYSFDNAGTHTFKGLDEPQEVWQVGQTGDA